MNKRIILPVFGIMAAFSMSAHTTLFEEHFDNKLDWRNTLPTLIDADNLPALPKVNPIFMDTDGVSQPWWFVKDASTSEDGFLASHSNYQYGGGKSNDWVTTVPITIPSKDFTLTFGAQSGTVLDGAAKLSSLWVFITEEAPTKDNLPTEAAMVIENVPCGKSETDFEKDFTSYSLNLDAYAGKTVYISFANLNDDRDILAIDDILVRRLDEMELTLEAPEYSIPGDFSVKATVKNTSGENASGLKISFDGQNPTDVEALAANAEKEYTSTSSVEADEDTVITATLSKEGKNDIVATAVVKGVSSMPQKRVLIEEATGVWCGNCPLGMYNIESMVMDEEMKDLVVPVSVHINGSAAQPNSLVLEGYSYTLGLQQAPTLRLNRGKEALYFSTTNDAKFDKTNEKSMAYRILQESKKVTLFDISVKGEYIMEGPDTIGIKARALVTPTRTTRNELYKVGFILTENNVALPGHRNFIQENYLSGYPIEGGVGGFCELPEKIRNMRLQDVARGIYNFYGIDYSLPAEMKMDEEYPVTVDIELPSTYDEDSNGKCSNPEIKKDYLTLIAFIINDETHEVANVAFYPMTEKTEQRFTIADILAEYKNGVDEIEASDANAPEEYFTIDGLRVSHPEKGNIYIVRKGAEISKIVY